MPASSTPQARCVRARLASAPRLVDGCLLGYADIGTSELVVQLKYHDKHEILTLIQDGPESAMAAAVVRRDTIAPLQLGFHAAGSTSADEDKGRGPKRRPARHQGRVRPDVGRLAWSGYDGIRQGVFG
jgi:hypothetical protein